MNCGAAGYKKARNKDGSNETRGVLVKAGWKNDMAENTRRREIKRCPTRCGTCWW